MFCKTTLSICFPNFTFISILQKELYLQQCSPVDAFAFAQHFSELLGCVRFVINVAIDKVFITSSAVFANSFQELELMRNSYQVSRN